MKSKRTLNALRALKDSKLFATFTDDYKVSLQIISPINRREKIAFKEFIDGLNSAACFFDYSLLWHTTINHMVWSRFDFAFRAFIRGSEISVSASQDIRVQHFVKALFNLRKLRKNKI